MQVWQGGTGEGASIGRHRPISRIVMMMIIVNSRYHVCLARVPSQVWSKSEAELRYLCRPFPGVSDTSFLPFSHFYCGQSQTPTQARKTDGEEAS